MGNNTTRHDFDWTDQDQPHNKRRAEMLKKYPQIKNLFGVDPTFKWKVVTLVLVQITVLQSLKNFPWILLVLLAYAFGGIINHALMLGIHEIAHGAGFGVQHPLANSLLGIFVNLPIGFPVYVTFKRYHLDHHWNLGKDTIDTDIPSEFEAKLFCTSFGKLLWVILQPVFYIFRPIFVNPKVPLHLEYVNMIVQVSFDIAIGYCFGVKPLFFLIGGSFMSMGFHPLAGHFISEHYMFKEGYETYSYYGLLNMVTFNVGYHNEHHDFPNIPASRLPEVRKFAPEFYDNLPFHDSWVRVIWNFIIDPNLGLYARVKRKQFHRN